MAVMESVQTLSALPHAAPTEASKATMVGHCLRRLAEMPNLPGRGKAKSNRRGWCPSCSAYPQHIANLTRTTCESRTGHHGGSVGSFQGCAIK